MGLGLNKKVSLFPTFYGIGTNELKQTLEWKPCECDSMTKLMDACWLLVSFHLMYEGLFNTIHFNFLIMIHDIKVTVAELPNIIPKNGLISVQTHIYIYIWMNRIDIYIHAFIHVLDTIP